ncbi:MULTISPECIES: hypothetical protein [Micromonospora]|uniref:Uncharacterized protein n=1 Tax=Micromonospora tulbaghiae TaxID=479978 RepID=A0A386WFZ5_9ACTN|nr:MULTISPECIES: hypothetical protein [Micromonospora]AYF26429.1 hypothetical protein CSH63_02885 [Micromonospora tulbaghiae]MCO1615017.1 hypothetical protein [Micromonospora sp. CPM1]NED49814.1 hypothetical protein [Micromonospora aurantiaca]RLQ07594.1 hypothetical protein EAD96_06190 [Micromonospora sp. BL1]
MTSAPANLLAVRNLLLTYLNVDKKAVRADDLEPAEVGIVGDVNHRGGYHCGSDRVVTNDYSVVESSRDRSGLTLYASALDVGTFSVRSGGGTHNLRTFSAWMVAQCAANAADTRDIREIIYSPDGRTVRRWDRLGRRTSGDSSHLFHTHFSFFRDSTKAGRDQTPLFRRYLTAIGMIAVVKPEDDMEQTDKLIGNTGSKGRTVGDVLADLQNLRNWLISPVNTTGLVNPPMANSPLQQMLAMLRAWPALVAQVNELSGKDFTDEEQIVSGVLAGLPPEKIAEAIPPQIARDVADELSRRLTA